MTIITKPVSGKKTENLDEPLVENDHLATAPPGDVESQNIDRTRFLNFQARAARRVSVSTTLCLLLTGLIVVGMGIVAGTYLYRQFLRAQMHRFQGWCNIPYNSDSQQAMLMSSDNDVRNSDALFDAANINEDDFNKFDFFQEQFELDLDGQDYEKIDVPDFRDGRKGRFVHDFNINLTGIIDVSGQRCFVMPLNRTNVLLPRSLYDLLQKMWDGYYRVDTDVVRQTMRVVTPPINDTKEIGSYIAKECQGLPVYKLEKYVGGIVKRSAELPVEAKFAQFSGRGILEYDIMNLQDALEFEGGETLQ